MPPRTLGRGYIQGYMLPYYPGVYTTLYICLPPFPL